MNTSLAIDKRLICPSCGKKGKRVGPATLCALIKEEFLDRIAVVEHSDSDSGEHCESGCRPISGDTGWRFCESPECDVVYFEEEGGTAITKSQLRVAVGVKEKSGDRPLCYCFGHSVASIKEEFRAKGRSDVLEVIRSKMNDPGCRCEVTNPSGSCCLGSVTRGIQIAREELGMKDENANVMSLSRPHVGRGERIAKIGTLVSAVMASSCCWLPLLLLAAGVSGAGIAATLETYRPWFIVVTFGFLGAAFYFTYRPKKAVAEGGHGCCAPEATSGEACCAPATQGRFSIMAFNKVILWVVTVLAVAFLLFPKYVGFFLASQAGENETTATSPLVSRTNIAIEGMTCEACSVALQKAIKGVPGVLGAKVDFKKGQAVVSTEACCPFPKDEILQAVTDAGYSGTVMESKP